MWVKKIVLLLVTVSSLQCASWREYLRSIGSGYAMRAYENKLYHTLKANNNFSKEEVPSEWALPRALMMRSKKLRKTIELWKNKTIGLQSAHFYVDITCKQGRIVAYKESIDGSAEGQSRTLISDYAREYDMCARLNAISRYNRLVSSYALVSAQIARKLEH